MKRMFAKGMACSLMAVAAVCVCLLSACQQEKKERLMDVETPVWQKFVMVNKDEVPILKEPNANSPRLLSWMEDLESDMVDVQFKWDDEQKPADNYIGRPENLFMGAVLPVLAEEGDYYKVNVYDSWRTVEEAYIAKDCADEIATAPITPEVVSEHMIDARVIDEGPLKGLFLMSRLGENDEEMLEVGELRDGCILAPQQAKDIYPFFSEEQQGLLLETGAEMSGASLKYGPAETDSVMAEGYEFCLADVKKLSTEQVDSIYSMTKNEKPAYVKVYYYFPEYRMFDGDNTVQPFYQVIHQ